MYYYVNNIAKRAIIDNENKGLQAQSATLDIETKNIGDLTEELKDLRYKWIDLYAEAKLVAANMTKSIDCEKVSRRKNPRKEKFSMKLEMPH